MNILNILKKALKRSTRKIIYTVLYIFSMIYATTPAILVIKNMLNPKNKGKITEVLKYNELYKKPFTTLKCFFINPSLWLSVFSIIIIAAILIAIIVFLNKEKQGINNNVKYLKDNGTHGTANWMDEEEAKQLLNIGNRVDGIIYGALNGKNVALPFDTWKFNKNVAIFGAPGTGKSRFYLRTVVCQLVQNKKSIVITDPKGELMRDLKVFLESQGYDVKVFNLVNMKNSHRWNPLNEVTDDLSAQVFSQTIIDNTKPVGSKGDEFWEKGEQNLLKALTLYVIYELPESERNLREMYSLLAGKDVKEMDRLFSALPGDHPAKQPYKLFSQSADNVRSGMIIGLGTRLQVFQNQLVQALTETSDIDLSAPAKKPCAYFCITSDMTSTFDFLSGLFFSFLFINLVNYADLHSGKCDPEVYFMLDEFPNIASIPDFQKKISTMRSRGVHCHVIFQNIAQLQNRYPNFGWSEIIGNCDSKLFLGCTDLLTAEFVSKLLGITTVEDSSNSKSGGLEGLFDFGKNTTRATKRNLLNPDEILQFPTDKEILMLKGQKPLILDKRSYEFHPLSKNFRPIEITDFEPEWSKGKDFSYHKKSPIDDIEPISSINKDIENMIKDSNIEDMIKNEKTTSSKKTNKKSNKNSNQISLNDFFN
ncbi:type IV secretory system conjugative DNA transfer family protein [Clostridium botulinum]|uniref:VirD4-like conjugal transfer protein, CD1115 family n=1 Tax=Clostridium botulinum TaxID=1491 RepID=UPI00174B73B0|nr:type IV secretory system conjugative DNA transfer family protein [Clostridium botulinum]MBD5640603.1 type IV secretory system conjugative DNA transfer family protein [Clostridium botulinum]MDI6919056.1 type IV secretory system conjugative DNA transfer family protein [Clostridium botulinum]WMU99727.1 type IV secretory system conjugative DNA transfer family protein [Clostridium botulinum]